MDRRCELLFEPMHAILHLRHRKSPLLSYNCAFLLMSCQSFFGKTPSVGAFLGDGYWITCVIKAASRQPARWSSSLTVLPAHTWYEIPSGIGRSSAFPVAFFVP